ncbi:hypothetical protein CBR_g37246 [Chara braunii]|uniref:Uncharacterized protein n=1 Tax=Chara braunii TaxID=69332 RepID=A0A388LMN2_CHABU|nr:hypothetical protein CBR_g37246 [Chara braunii]|eukprot:GBG83531.1 hypothetical protein CBR_g37246 [Chara braunii]
MNSGGNSKPSFSVQTDKNTDHLPKKNPQRGLTRRSPLAQLSPAAKTIEKNPAISKHMSEGKGRSVEQPCARAGQKQPPTRTAGTQHSRRSMGPSPSFDLFRDSDIYDSDGEDTETKEEMAAGKDGARERPRHGRALEGCVEGDQGQAGRHSNGSYGSEGESDGDYDDDDTVEGEEEEEDEENAVDSDGDEYEESGDEDEEYGEEENAEKKAVEVDNEEEAAEEEEEEEEEEESEEVGEEEFEEDEEEEEESPRVKGISRSSGVREPSSKKQERSETAEGKGVENAEEGREEQSGQHVENGDGLHEKQQRLKSAEKTKQESTNGESNDSDPVRRLSFASVPPQNGRKTPPATSKPICAEPARRKSASPTTSAKGSDNNNEFRQQFASRRSEKGGTSDDGKTGKGETEASEKKDGESRSSPPSDVTPAITKSRQTPGEEIDGDDESLVFRRHRKKGEMPVKKGTSASPSPSLSSTAGRERRRDSSSSSAARRRASTSSSSSLHAVGGGNASAERWDADASDLAHQLDGLDLKRGEKSSRRKEVVEPEEREKGGREASTTTIPRRRKLCAVKPQWTPQSEEKWRQDAYKAVCGESGESDEWEEEGDIPQVVEIDDSPIVRQEGGKAPQQSTRRPDIGKGGNDVELLGDSLRSLDVSSSRPTREKSIKDGKAAEQQQQQEEEVSTSGTRLKKAMDGEGEKTSSPSRVSATAESNGERSAAAAAVDEDLILGGGKYILRAKVAKMLYAHQIGGVKWLWTLHEKKMGGILGDDMGLGKTMQVAAFLDGLFRSKLVRKALIVAPGTLLPHWEKELGVVGLAKVTDKYHGGTPLQRERVLMKVLQRGGVLLTTYEMVNYNVKALRGDIHGRDGFGDTGDDLDTWDYVILDEGHTIKNHTTKKAQNLRLIPSGIRVIISGTPIQNNLREMWALYDYCCEGLLGDLQYFREEYEKKITNGSHKEASQREKVIGNAAAKALRNRIAPFFLRREKKDVFPSRAKSDDDTGATEASQSSETASTAGKESTLGRKNDLIVWLPPTRTQERLYVTFTQSDYVKSILNESRSALAALGVLKKICVHPELLTKNASDIIEEGAEELLNPTLRTARKGKGIDDDFVEAVAMAKELVETRDSGIREEDEEQSCKIKFLFSLMKNLIADGHRTLIFSQSKKMLDIIQEKVKANRVRHCRIDGDVSKPADRQRLVDKFQSDESISLCLLTTQVGGLGLTLTGADRVIIVDPAWNPSVDNQAVDRAYRIGQERDVIVYRLITCGTIEEVIYRRQVFKAGLMKTAVEKKRQTSYFSRQELEEVFRVKIGRFKKSETQEQLEMLHGDEQAHLPDNIKKHIGFLKQSGAAGVSQHDLLYKDENKEKLPDYVSPEKFPTSARRRSMAGFPGRPQTVQKTSQKPQMRPGMSAVPDKRAQAIAAKRDQVGMIGTKLGMLETQLEAQMKHATNESFLGKLPDGGQRIKQKVVEISNEIERLRCEKSKLNDELRSLDSDSSSDNTHWRSATSVFPKIPIIDVDKRPSSSAADELVSRIGNLSVRR